MYEQKQNKIPTISQINPQKIVDCMYNSILEIMVYKKVSLLYLEILKSSESSGILAASMQNRFGLAATIFFFLMKTSGNH